MKITAFSNFFKGYNIKRTLSFIMVLLILLLSTACSCENEHGLSSQASGSSSQNNSSDISLNSSSSTTSSGTVSGENSSDSASFQNSSTTPSGNTSTNTSTNISNNTSNNISTNTSTGSSNKGDISSKDESGTQDQTPSNPEPSVPIEPNKNEIIVDPSNLMTNYKGYADTERNKRLNEILNTPNTLELYDVKGTIYYVSTSGNDKNDGLTPETAIQNLEAVDKLPLKDGDAVLFERGCVWRMLKKFNCRSNITYGSYGKGRKPMFLGSATNFAQRKWQASEKKNVWKVRYIYEYPCGAFFDQGKEAGYLKTSLQSLTANTHFFHDENAKVLYLYCDKGNPSEVWDSIEFSQGGTKIHLGTNVSNVVIDNIAIRYTGQGGIGALYANHHFTVTNCEIGFTGGAWVGGNPSSNLRYCNGIESWCGGKYLTWEHNWIYQTFDSAMTPQGRSGGTYNDVSMCDNLLEFNNCDFESWETNADNPAKYSNYFMDNNICRFTSLGWGTREEDGGIRGIDGVHYGQLKKDQITNKYSFSNNIIDCPGRMIYKFTIANKGAYDKYTRKNNVYYIKQSIRTTNALTSNFHWKDNNNRVAWHTGDTKEKVLNAFAEFEPNSKVFWYN